MLKEYSEDPSQESGDSSSDFSIGKDNNIKQTFSITSSNSHLKRKFGSKINAAAATPPQHKQLFSSLQRLNAILTDIQGSCLNNSGSNSKCLGVKRLSSQITIPTSEDKLSLEKLISLIESVSEQLKSEVYNFIKASANNKTRLAELENDNSILRQRLTTALNMQKNMEGELKQLSRENKLLEAENKNLAIKIVPYLPSGGPFRADLSSKSQINMEGKEDGANDLHANKSLDDDGNDIGNNNTMEDVSDEESQFTLSSDDSTTCDMKVPPGKCEDNMKKKKDIPFIFDPGDIAAKSRMKETSKGFRPAPDKIENLKKKDIDGEKEAELKSETTNNNRQEELDSITSYVRWKTVDFGRLHGKLNKNFEELQKLKQAMNSMSQEKEEILSDLEVLANSCRDLSRERDNYESILKMILREKNSPESNLSDLLDGLLHHLSGSCTATCTSSCQNSAKCFLESALHVVQEQNLAIREEMAQVKEALQRTSGQNCFLQSTNEMLTGKVLELQKELESKQEELEQNGNKEKKDKLEKMEELYKEVVSAKDALNEQLADKERELEGIKKLVELKNKAIDEQTEKLADLQFDNEKMQKELTKYKGNVERMTQMILHLKASLREQKGKWHDRVRSTSNDLQNTKQHCQWLQSQIDHLNNQLADAHERIKLHEKDKAILAQKVLTAEEERKTLDRKILEIKSIMHGDTVYREALAERNQDLQMEVNRLRKEKLWSESRIITAGGEGEEDISYEKFTQHLQKYNMNENNLENNNNGENQDYHENHNFQENQDFQENSDQDHDNDQDQTNNTMDELSSIASAPLENSFSYVAQTPTPSSPLISRRHRINQQYQYQHGLLSPIRRNQYDVPRAANQPSQVELNQIECGII